jgi:hypothetical protein
MTRDLLHIDRDHLDLRLAAGAVMAILIAELLEVVLGIGLVQSGVAAFLVFASSRSGALRPRLVHMGVVTLIGGAMGFLAYLSADTAWQAALVLAAVAYVTGLAYGYGPAMGKAGSYLLGWALVIQIGTAEGTDPPASAASFLVGGAIAMIVVAVLGVLGRIEQAPSDEAAAPRGVRPSLTDVATSGVGIWSLVRALLVVLAVVVGYPITNDFDPYWVAIVVLVVFLPATDRTAFKATQRAIGTLLGVAGGTALLTVTASEPVVFVALLVAAFFTVAFYAANYLIYAFFLTVTIVFYEWFGAGEQMGAAGQRLLAAAIGVLLALLGIVIMEQLARRKAAADPADGAA